jgi:hypothetical protein
MKDETHPPMFAPYPLFFIPHPFNSLSDEGALRQLEFVFAGRSGQLPITAIAFVLAAVEWIAGNVCRNRNFE